MAAILKSKLVRVLAWSAAATVVVFALFWLHLFNHVGLDDWMERRFLQYASHSAATVHDARVLLITIPPGDADGLGAFDDGKVANQKWREHHARLIGKLAAAQARIIAFDLSFPAANRASASANAALVDAIRKVRETPGTAVIVGAERDMDRNPELEAVLPLEEMGLVSMREMTFDANSDQYLARVLLAESTVSTNGLGTEERILRPLPLPLAMYLADRRPERGEASLAIDPARGALVIRWQGGETELITAEIRTCEHGDLDCTPPADAQPGTLLRRAVLPLWMGRAVTFTPRGYASVLNQESLGSSYRQRVVLVGALTPEELQKMGPGAPKDPVFGVHVHARVFSDLVHGTYLRHAAAWLQVVSIVVVLLLGLAARLYMPVNVVKIPIGWLKDFPLPVGFFVVAGFYLFAAAMIFRASFVFFDLAYQLLALTLGYYAIPALAHLDDGKAKEAAP
jgi:CHASE2 domain-containing sensor protein